MKRAIIVVAGLLLLLLLLFHFYCLDGIHGFLLRVTDPDDEDTAFAEGYSEGAFRWLRNGATREEILGSLGPPLAKVWDYIAGGGVQIRFRIEAGRVSEIIFDRTQTEQTVNIGDAVEDVIARLGPPSQEDWIYSYSPSNSSYRERSLTLENGILTQKWHDFYID